MEHITKNKLLVVIYAILVSVGAFLLVEREKELWGKLGLMVLAVILIALCIANINRIKYYTLIDDILIIRHTFSKEKQYSLKAVSGWTENHYQLLGIKTGREIVIKINGESKIRLFEKNSKDFEKLSDYLNENSPEAFENHI